MKRNCTNCAFCERFKYSSEDKTEMMRCWEEPGVCDHAFVQSMSDAEDYVCDEHRTKKKEKKSFLKRRKSLTYGAINALENLKRNILL